MPTSATLGGAKPAASGLRLAGDATPHEVADRHDRHARSQHDVGVAERAELDERIAFVRLLCSARNRQHDVDADEGRDLSGHEANEEADLVGPLHDAARGAAEEDGVDDDGGGQRRVGADLLNGHACSVGSHRLLLMGLCVTRCLHRV